MLISVSNLAFFDGDLAAIFQSPMIVPVAFAFMILGIVVAGIWAGVRNREMRSQERLAAIAKGVSLEPTWNEAMLRSIQQPTEGRSVARPSDGSTARRAGIVLLSVGVALACFFLAISSVERSRGDFDDAAGLLIAAATGFIPGCIGIGFLIDARMRRVEYARALEEARAVDTAAAPQNSGLRPLH